VSWLVNLALGLVGTYAALVAIMYFAQTWLLFPTGIAALGRPELPIRATRLQVTTPDAERLIGVRLPPAGAEVTVGSILLGFPGNAWDARAMALTLSQLLPEHEAVVFHYRGYAPSGGRVSANALLTDSVTIFDHLAGEVGERPVIAVGVSVGSPVAAYLARHRPVAGLVLITPFDSLVELARDHYPWLPVRQLLRHRMPTLDYVRNLETPTAIILAGADTIVPPRRSQPLQRAVRNLVFVATIEAAGHNDLYDRPAFRAAIRDAVARVEAAAGLKPSQPQLN
jgi:pimeloyl-ACP methyl ester carboxylesterase